MVSTRVGRGLDRARGRVWQWLAGGAALALAALILPTSPGVSQGTAQAQEPAAEETYDPDVVAAGRRAYLRANCVFCHGWNGRGSLVEGEPPAPGFIETGLDFDGLVETITCGRMSTTMRRHLRTAWTPAQPCYGLVEADLMPGEMPLPPYNYLNERDIRAVATFILAVFKDKEMTYENCIAWFREGARQCEEYR